MVLRGRFSRRNVLFTIRIGVCRLTRVGLHGLLELSTVDNNQIENTNDTHKRKYLELHLPTALHYPRRITNKNGNNKRKKELLSSLPVELP